MHFSFFFQSILTDFGKRIGGVLGGEHGRLLEVELQSESVFRGSHMLHRVARRLL